MTQEADSNKNKKKPTKGRGGKLNRSEIVHLRLNPKTRYALELMARNEQRTVSSFLETLVNKEITHTNISILPPAPRIHIPSFPVDKEMEKTSLQRLLQLTWHPNEIHRFVAMSMYAPNLLTSDEELTWSIIRGTNYYWSFYKAPKVHMKTKELLGEQLMRIHTMNGIIWEHVEAHWHWLVTHNVEDIVKDLKRKDMHLKPGKITTRPIDFPEVFEAMTEEETLQLVNRLNKYFDKFIYNKEPTKD